MHSGLASGCTFPAACSASKGHEIYTHLQPGVNMQVYSYNEVYTLEGMLTSNYKSTLLSFFLIVCGSWISLQ